jgi:hypothetical protein
MIYNVFNIVGLSYQTWQCILSGELNTRLIASTSMPRLLTDDQNQRRLEVSTELKERVRNNPDSLSKNVTGDKSWIFG